MDRTGAGLGPSAGATRRCLRARGDACLQREGLFLRDRRGRRDALKSVGRWEESELRPCEMGCKDTVWSSL